MLQNLCCSWCSFMTIGYQPIDSFSVAAHPSNVRPAWFRCASASSAFSLSTACYSKLHQADAPTDTSSSISFSQIFHAFSSSLTNAFRSFAPMTSQAMGSNQTWCQCPGQCPSFQCSTFTALSPTARLLHSSRRDLRHSYEKEYKEWLDGWMAAI